MVALRVGIVVGLVLSALVATPAAATTPAAAGDAVVVAVIDGALNPYHWDLSATAMPQAGDGDPANDLPLHTPPHTWLRGFPAPDVFGGYRPFPLSAGTQPDAKLADLYAADADSWSLLEPSSATSVQYYWVPGTKVVGMVDFGVNRVHGPAGAHGSKVASVAVGNLHGTCPQCLLVFLSYSTEAQAEAASRWAQAQPWIDVVVNSYGFSSSGRFRDRVYSGSDVAAQRAASERGQTVFFSAGNGLNNDFLLPNSTYFSSQEGPDWIVTVGATSATGHSYSGAGKPVDVSAPGDGSYPSMGGDTVTGSSGFGGTSNATPVVAGVYASALAWARARLDGASATQAGGTVAAGPPVTCGQTSPTCELGDGVLTARELRERLLLGASHTPQGLEAGQDGEQTQAVSPEQEFAAEGHGTFFGRGRGDAGWQQELAAVTGPLDGTAAPLPRPDGEAEWFAVDSYCRQQIWGSWEHGDWRATDPVPAPSPLWPVRSALAATCPAYRPAPTP